MEGGFLCRRYRFEDVRTERVGRGDPGVPTRLVERSVPIALYDLGYNLGIARRLFPEVDVGWAAAGYARIAEAWNRDQLRLLRAAARAAQAGTVEALQREESARVRAHDEALVGECDGLLGSLERALWQRPAHRRGHILSSVALAMGLAACRTQPFTLPPPDAQVRSDDLAAACPGTRLAEPDIPMCLCPFASTVRVTLDGSGVVVSVTAADGSPLPDDVKSCLDEFFKNYCYPSLANTTREVLSSHCWVA